MLRDEGGRQSRLLGTRETCRTFALVRPEQATLEYGRDQHTAGTVW